jgi:anti-sigma regulatory factor (Ser/Thr protein kinase)
VLAVNEAVTNIIKHAYGGLPEQRVQIAANGYNDHIDLELFDEGRSFDAEGIADPDFDGSRDHGFGMFIIEQCMDHVRYLRDETGRNCLRLTKRVTDA